MYLLVVKSGKRTCMNLSSSPCTFPISLGPHGNSGSHHCWWLWKGTCAKCAKLTTVWEGIFCHNFGASCKDWTQCQFASWAECFEASPMLSFLVNRDLEDESQYYKRHKEDEKAFLVARNGEWMLSPFQYKNCWFVNLCDIKHKTNLLVG